MFNHDNLSQNASQVRYNWDTIKQYQAFWVTDNLAQKTAYVNQSPRHSFNEAATDTGSVTTTRSSTFTGG